jgi:hypothetical protein
MFKNKISQLSDGAQVCIIMSVFFTIVLFIIVYGQYKYNNCTKFK